MLCRPEDARPISLSPSLMFSVDYFLPFDHTDCKNGYVIFLLRVKARHFSSFAAYERTAGHDAAISHTLYDLRNLSACFSQGLCNQENSGSLRAYDIVDTHCHSVDSDLSCLSIMNAIFSLVRRRRCLIPATVLHICPCPARTALRNLLCR